jgi:hypothetical protein
MSTPPDRVSGDAASFIGNIPEHYDTGLGPVIRVVDALARALRAEFGADLAGSRSIAIAHRSPGRARRPTEQES